MGTVVTLDLYDDESSAASPSLGSVIEEALAVLHAADAMFSTWKDDSCMSRIRRGELSIDAAPVDVAIVLEICREVRRMSEGWFDPWAMPNGLDPTGIVKGWAAQRCLDVLRHAQLRGALVNAAGDVASFGGPRRGERFRIGVADPSNPRRLACVVATPGAVATSGEYERGPHLIDPHTGLASTRALSATVVGPDLAIADALATALAVAGAEALSLLHELNDYEGFIITGDHAFLRTPAFPFADSTTPCLA